MPKKLFEEALADVKQVKQVAEDNAKRAILEAVTPRIREFIDRALLQEDERAEIAMVPGHQAPRPTGEEEAHREPDGDELVVVDDPVALGAVVAPVGDAVPAGAITPPDAEGKVTLDIDSLCSTEPGAPVPPPQFGEPVPPHEEEYEVSLESIEALKPVLSASRKLSNKALEERIDKLTERVNLFQKASKAVKATPAFRKQIAQLILQVENMYDYVQESVADSRKKSSYETTLEAGFKVLNTLQESTTMAKNKKQMNEADVTLKLTGLPDDVDLDSVGVDLITGEDEEGMEGGDQGGADADLGDLDLGGQQGSEEGEDTQMGESRRLSDDTVVEIDENMLRREIARMRTLREETKPQSWGHGADDAEIVKDFGGGKSEGEPTEADIVDKSPAPAALPLGESDDQDLEEGQDDLDEGDDQDDDLEESQDQDLEEGQDDLDQGQDQLDQGYDDLDQIGNRSKKSQFGDDVADGHYTATWDKRRHEGLKRLSFEKKLQERAKDRAAALKKEAAAAKARKNAKRLAECKKEYAVVVKRFNESVARSNKAKQIVASATAKLQEARSNSAATRSAGNRTEDSLRKKLAETNLINAKLLYTNKLLQNEQMNPRQKAAGVKQLQGAKTVAEAKIVFESLQATLSSSQRTVTEGADRKVMGSGSRATRPAATQSLNEGYEAERWAKLAGIVK